MYDMRRRWRHVQGISVAAAASSAGEEHFGVRLSDRNGRYDWGGDSLLRTYVRRKKNLIFSIGNLHQVMGASSNAVSDAMRMTVDVKLIGAGSQRQLDWLIRPCREKYPI